MSKFTFTASFETKEDLKVFMLELFAMDSAPAGIKVDVASAVNQPVIDAPPAEEIKATVKKKATPKPTVTAVDKPAVVETIAPEVHAPNHAEVLEAVRQKIKHLGEIGMKGEKFQAEMAEMYVLAGCQMGKKVGELSPSELNRFLPVFENKYAALVAMTNASASSFV